MFELTEDEKAAIARAEEALRAYQEKSRILQRIDYGAPKEEREAAQREASAALEASNALQTDETVLVAVLKTEANKAIGAKLPGGSYVAILAMAEQTLALLDTPTGARTTGLLRTVALRVLAIGHDEELQVARAKGTKARYDALVGTGLPEDFVRQIMVAEASRPWPSSPSGSVSRK